jgi:hypothetical protein
MLISPSHWRDRSIQAILVTAAYADQAHHNPLPQFNGFHRLERIGPKATLAQNRIDLEILSLTGRPSIKIMAVRGDEIFQIRGLIAKEIYRISDVAVEVALIVPGALTTLACCVGISELPENAAAGRLSPPCISLCCVLTRCHCVPESKYSGYMPGDCGSLCTHCAGNGPYHLRGSPCDTTKFACWNQPRYDCDHHTWSLGSPLPDITLGHRDIIQSYRQLCRDREMMEALPSEDPADSDMDIIN